MPCWCFSKKSFKFRFQVYSFGSNRSISHIPQCIIKYPTMHHFVTEMCTDVHILLQNGALWDMGLVHCGIRVKVSQWCFSDHWLTWCLAVMQSIMAPKPNLLIMHGAILDHYTSTNKLKRKPDFNLWPFDWIIQIGIINQDSNTML